MTSCCQEGAILRLDIELISSHQLDGFLVNNIRLR